MTGQDLKNSILQLAIQGKLVAQDANDEPASVLLERIKAEKKKLIEEKKIKKEKPLAEITEDEKPFEIPDSWVWVRLGEIFSMQAGKTIKADELSSEPDNSHIYPCFGGNGIRGYIAKKNCYGKACIIGRQGALCGNINIADNEYYATEHAVVVTQFANTNVDWAYYFLTASNLNQYATATAQPGLAVSKITETLIPLPPLSEQKRIVAKIEELMPLVDEYDKAQKELDALNSAMPEQLKQSILQEAIMGKLGTNNPDDEPASELLKRIRKEKEQLIKDKKIKKEKPLPEITDEEKPFDIPDNWVWCRLGEIGVYKKGPFGSALTKSIFVPKSNNSVKVYEQKNAIQKDYSLGGYYITKEYFEQMKGFEVFPNDIIISCAGTIGETYIIPEGAPQGIINQALMRAKLIDTSISDFWILFFKYILLSSETIKGNGSAIKNIPPFDIFKNYLIALPPLAEQHRIVSKIENLFACIDPLAKDLK